MVSILFKVLETTAHPACALRKDQIALHDEMMDEILFEENKLRGVAPGGASSKGLAPRYPFDDIDTAADTAVVTVESSSLRVHH